MSNRWPGGIIRKTPVTPAGPFQNGAASGVWSLADAAYWTKQGLWPIAGKARLHHLLLQLFMVQPQAILRLVFLH
jgi:hypothetical protein